MNSERIPYGDDACQFLELWHFEQAVAGFAVVMAILAGEARSHA